MRQKNIQQTNLKKGGKYGARFIFALLVVGLALSMSTGVFAAEIRHGRGAGYMLHRADGTAYTSRALTEKERNLYLDWEAKIYDTARSEYTSNNEMHVMNITVGQTVVLHAAQETIQFNEKGVRTLYRWYTGEEPSVSFKTVAGVEDLSTYTKSNLSHTKADGQDYYCLEWYVTGETVGVDYIWYFDNPFDPQYLKIIVSEGSGTQSAAGERNRRPRR